MGRGQLSGIAGWDVGALLNAEGSRWKAACEGDASIVFLIRILSIANQRK